MYNIVIKDKIVYDHLSNEEKDSTLKMLKTIIDNKLLNDFKYTFDDIKVEEVYDFDNQRNVSYLLKRQMFV